MLGLIVIAFFTFRFSMHVSDSCHCPLLRACGLLSPLTIHACYISEPTAHMIPRVEVIGNPSPQAMNNHALHGWMEQSLSRRERSHD